MAPVAANEPLRTKLANEFLKYCAFSVRAVPSGIGFIGSIFFIDLKDARHLAVPSAVFKTTKVVLPGEPTDS